MRADAIRSGADPIMTLLDKALRAFVIAQARERKALQRVMDDGGDTVAISAAEHMAINTAKVECDRAANLVLAMATDPAPEP